MERTPQQVTGDLDRLGVRHGDLVLVHASLRAIGPVAGGANGVLEALQGAIGPTGTLMVNVGVRDDWSWVNERPERERADLLRHAEPFDSLATPADPDNGVFAEVFRTRADTVVSDHPEGRFAASGPLAVELLSDVPWDDYYGGGSPLERLVRAGGHVLRLGADLDTMTLIHYAENIVELPDKRRVRRHRLVTTPQGPAIRVVDTLDDSNNIVDRPGEDYFAIIMREYVAAAPDGTGTVGNAVSELIDAADFVEFSVAWMLAHLRQPGLTETAG